MSFWKSAKDTLALSRLADEAFHALALREIESGRRRDGLWAKAIIEANGDEARAKVAYIKLLVLALKDEAYLSERAQDLSRSTEEPPQASRPPPPPRQSQRPLEGGREGPGSEAQSPAVFLLIVFGLFLVVIVIAFSWR